MSLEQFIQKARDQTHDNDTILRVLLRHGWSESSIDTAFLGQLAVPAPDTPTPPDNSIAVKTNAVPSRNAMSTGPLFSALHHVLLWFFAGAAAFATASAISTLLGESASVESLASFIAVSGITFVPYVVIFAVYLRQQRTNPQLVPGKIWSVITVCLGSIGVMSSAIAMVVAAIISESSATFWSALTLCVLFGCIVATYAAAAFVQRMSTRVKRFLMYGPMILVLAILATLFVSSLTRIGPIRRDEALRTSLVDTVSTIRSYAQLHRALPETGSLNIADTRVRYQKRSDTVYQLCAPLSRADSSEKKRQPIDDAYVTESDFEHSRDGCFEVQHDATAQYRNF